MISLLIWGNKRGQKVFYTNVTTVEIESCIEDPTTFISIHEPKIKYYSLDSVKDKIVYSCYVSIFDWDIRSRCVLAISILLDKKYKIGGGKKVKNLLDELTLTYLSLYLDTMTNSIKKINEDWSIFDNIVNKYHVEALTKPKAITLEEKVSKYAIIKYNEADLDDYLDNPFREQYRGFKEIYFIPTMQQEIVAAPQLTDLTQHVPPREKSYKVQINFKASQIGASLPQLEEKHIDFRVNHHKCDLNTEVYNRDEITVEVNHPKCEDFNKSYKIGEELILNDKIILDIALTLRPRIIEIIIVKEVDQASIHGLVIELSKNGKSKTVRANNEGKYVEEIPYNETFYYKVTSTDYNTEKGTIDFFSKDQLDIVLNRKKPIPINDPITDPFVKDSSEFQETSDKDQNERETKKSDWKKNIVNIGEDRKAKFIIVAMLFTIILIVSTIIYLIIFNEPKPNPYEYKANIDASETNLQNSVDSSVVLLKADSIEISKLNPTVDSTKINIYYAKYSDNHYRDSLKIHPDSLLLFKLYSSNKDTIGRLKKAVDENNAIAAKKNSSQNGNTNAELNSEEKNKFDSQYTIQELTKINTKGNNNRLIELKDILKNKNTDKYKKRYDALNKIFHKINECRLSPLIEQKVACLTTLQTSEYKKNLSNEQKEYIDNKFEDFKNKVIQNQK